MDIDLSFEMIGVEKEELENAEHQGQRTEAELIIAAIDEAHAETEKEKMDLKIAKADAEMKMEQAKAEAEKAKADAENAEMEAQSAIAEAERAKADVDKANAEAEKQKAEAKKAKADVDKANAEAEKQKAEAERAMAMAEKAMLDLELERTRMEVEKMKLNAQAEVANFKRAKEEADEQVNKRNRVAEELNEISRQAELLNCCICKNLPTDPRQLPCGHSFCLNCLQNMHEIYGEITCSYGCPTLCITNPEQLPKNYAVNCVVTNLNRSADQTIGSQHSSSNRITANWGRSIEEEQAGFFFDVFVKSIGNISPQLIRGLQASTTVTAFKNLVYDKMGIPVEDQYLLFSGVTLQDGSKIGDYRIGPNATIQLVKRFLGGNMLV